MYRTAVRWVCASVGHTIVFRRLPRAEERAYEARAGYEPAPQRRRCTYCGLGSSLRGSILRNIRRLIHHRRDHRRRLHQIGRHRMIVSVHAGMVRDAAVIERILNELESGQSHGIERQVVRAAGILDA